jgi:hypothetical protein
MSSDPPNDRRCVVCGANDLPAYAAVCPRCGAPLPPSGGVLSFQLHGGADFAATLIRWHVRDGQKVECDQPVCEIETDAATADLAAPRAGILRHLKCEGDLIRPGDTVARIV